MTGAKFVVGITGVRFRVKRGMTEAFCVGRMLLFRVAGAKIVVILMVRVNSIN